jgi:PAS domain S-box-containing protein
MQAFLPVTPSKSQPLELERARRFTDLVGRVGAVANLATNVRDVLRVVIDEVCTLIGWPVGHAWLRDPESKVLVPSDLWHLERGDCCARFRASTMRATLAPGEGFGVVLSGGKPVWFADLAELPCERAEAARRESLETGFAVPIMTGTEVAGVLEFFTDSASEPDQALLKTMEQVGTQLGRVIERERASRQEKFLAAILDHLAHPVFIKDRQHRWVLLNRAACKLWGYSMEELLGKSDPDFFPKDQADFFWRKDDEMFASGQTVAVEEERLTDADGKVHVLATTKVPLRDASGQVTHLVGIIHDITPLKEAEDALRRKTEQLAAEVQQRTAAMKQLDVTNAELEAFSYTVSHDLRAPLRSIDGFSQALLEDEYERLDEHGRDYLRRVRTNARRMGQVIDDLLVLGRVTRAEMHHESVNLSALVQTIVDELRARDPNRKVALTVADDIRVMGDPQLLRLALANLLDNAWKFTSKRDLAHIEFGASVQDGERVIHVRDDGVGFDMAYVHKLFHPFARLHDVEEFPGSGVGLATVQRIVRRHGGRVWAEGAVGRGATLYFTVP